MLIFVFHVSPKRRRWGLWTGETMTYMLLLSQTMVAIAVFGTAFAV
jgi:hypothetical protein